MHNYNFVVDFYRKIIYRMDAQNFEGCFAWLPIIAVTDAAVFSSKVDGVFLVVKVGATSRKACIQSKMLLDKVGANIFGAVLN